MRNIQLVLLNIAFLTVRILCLIHSVVYVPEQCFCSITEVFPATSLIVLNFLLFVLKGVVLAGVGVDRSDRNSRN